MTTPRINPNDPQWTAYALGELEGDRSAVDRLVETSPEAQALVGDLQATSAAVEAALAADDHELVLTTAQRAAIRRAADADGAAHAAPGRFAWLHLQWTGPVALAAVAALFVVIARQDIPLPAPLHMAQQEPTPARPTDALGLPPAQRSIAVPAEPRLTSSPERGTQTTAPGGTPPAGQAGNGATVTADAGRGSGLQAPPPPGIAGGADTITVSGNAPIVDKQSSERLVSESAPPAAAPPAALTGIGGSVGRGGSVSLGAVGDVVGRLPDRPVSGLAYAPPYTPPFFPPPGPSSFPPRRPNTEAYAGVRENGFIRPTDEPLATLSIDVDTASYSNVRRFLNQNQLPPADAVRIEELINYFTYDYPRPTGAHPIATSVAAASAPWNTRSRLVRVGITAREIDAQKRPASNLVFLVDVSGSMNTPQKLPLLKSALKLLVDQLGENDMVSMVTYASGTGVAMPPTSGDKKDRIARAIDDLQAGGSTNGAGGIQLAYQQAAAGFIRGGSNRVILMTDGDFNVGISDRGQLTTLIEDKAKSGVFLSVFGFGMGNLKDATLEALADRGNGHYAYIDSLSEARKVLVEEMSGTLVTVAKDVKIQVDFNPAKVEAYRLIGYENRLLRPEDFNNDQKDAGDMGAGHTVTALFEVVPRGGTVPGSVDPSVFQPAPRPTPQAASTSNDMLVVRVRYKQPDAPASTRLDVPFQDRGTSFANADADLRFAASVAAFGMILKNSPYKGDASLEWVRETASAAQGKDRGGYRDEFVSLVQKAITLRNGRQ